MTAFFSDKGKLSLPVVAHGPSKKYNPVSLGQPLCVEIIHMALGDVNDWWGKSEILVSSWAKTGGTPMPGVRLVNLMRKEIAKFDHIADLGAAEYGHQLIYYTPAYNGKPLRFSLEFLEIDRLDGKAISKIGKALQNFGTLPVFAPQLTFLSMAPEALEIGKRLYDLLNRNDVVLMENLDLSFSDPSCSILSSGRYVLVKGNQNTSTFTEKFKLAEDNTLRTKEGILAEQAGLTAPYIVIRINAIDKSEYNSFENDRAAQEILDQVLNQGLTQNLADLLSETVKTTKQYESVKKILELKKELNKSKAIDKQAELKTAIENELKNISEEQKTLLKEVLKL
jgi:hypothetical protein